MAIAAFAVLLLQSCKKGENDPFLSLKTRDARITGEWELSTSYSESRQSYTYDGTTTTSTSSSVYENGQEIYKSDSYTDTSVYSLVMEINKDGSSTFTYTHEGDIETESGTWYWANNAKNKTGIVINGDDMVIDRLAKDELVLKEDYNSKSTNPDGNNTEYSNVGTMTFTKKK